jgi:hypothetical protein
MQHVSIRAALCRVFKNQYMAELVPNLLAIPCFCLALVPVFIVLANMSTIISWLPAHGVTNFRQIVTMLIIPILAGTGGLLSLGVVAASLGADWYLEKMRVWRKKNDPAAQTLNGLTSIVDSLKDSINRLRELSQSMKTQVRGLSSVSRNAGVRFSGKVCP